jgi:hypothetical protein
MRRTVLPLLGLGCFLGLLLFTYYPVLFEDQQFAGGNTSYFDYPLYLRVQQEWAAGRWPLWDPGQNGGTPLLGNPMAAVLYPVKVLHVLLPYAWAVRMFVIVHTTIGFLGMIALGRSFGMSCVGCFLGGLSYGFGAPILFLYCNQVFQVGAAWIPWGLCAIDRLLRQQNHRGLAELAVILALQVMGGDPEAAYLTALCGVGYAILLAAHGQRRLSFLLTRPVVLGAVCIWIAAALGLGSIRIVGPGFVATNRLVLAAWVAVGIGIIWRWYCRPGHSRLAPLFARLGCACALAMALAAVQVLPALEFTRQSWRAVGIPADTLYRYSLDPFRVVEFIWPNLFGTSWPMNRSWLQAVPPVGNHEVWVGSLYLGGLPLALALSALGWKSGPLWRSWLTTVAVVGLLASFGKYGGPLWWGRRGPLAATLGWHDPGAVLAAGDTFLHDGAGSVYGLFAILLPGFGAFRHPSKIVTFTAVGLAMLAGIGWDRLMEERADTRRLRRLGILALGASLAGLACTLAARGSAVALLADRIPPDPLFGPADVAGAWTETQRALANGAIVYAAVFALARWAPSHARGAGALAILLLTADLALNNARLICTVPQAEFDAPSEAVRLIEEAEVADLSRGPFRVHRMPGCFPVNFRATSSSDRPREVFAWARETVYPLVALPLGVQYCATSGSLEIDDYIALFSPQMMSLPAGSDRILGVPAGQPVAYYPRRSFDLWGARYFVLPALPDWGSPVRGYASFLDNTELIYPSADVLFDTQGRDGAEPWITRQDWQLRRNKAAYPRAWLVHQARVYPVASTPDIRASLMRTLAFSNDPIWRENNRAVLDLRNVALIETDEPHALVGFLSPSPVTSNESVEVVRHEPQRVELRAKLDQPGLVILADTYYPGWRLTIDGQPAPVLRANRLMRGAAVAAGEHFLVYTYSPTTFLVGRSISAAGLILLLALLWGSKAHRIAQPLAWPDSGQAKRSWARQLRDKLMR